VATEATGVYWLPLYGVLEGAGFKVIMVNGRQTRNLLAYAFDGSNPSPTTNLRFKPQFGKPASILICD
jgi:transposase